jgi:protein-disulfide isomerase
MFEDASSESESEAEEAVYEVNHNEYVNFYETTLRDKKEEKEMKSKRKNECLVTIHDEMHSYLREVAY